VSEAAISTQTGQEVARPKHRCEVSGIDSACTFGSSDVGQAVPHHAATASAKVQPTVNSVRLSIGSLLWPRNKLREMILLQQASSACRALLPFDEAVSYTGSCSISCHSGEMHR
jgi:hypothetical protein